MCLSTAEQMDRHKVRDQYHLYTLIASISSTHLETND